MKALEAMQHTIAQAEFAQLVGVSEAKVSQLVKVQRQLFVKVNRKGGLKPLAGAFIGNKGRTVRRGRPVEPAAEPAEEGVSRCSRRRPAADRGDN